MVNKREGLVEVLEGKSRKCGKSLLTAIPALTPIYLSLDKTVVTLCCIKLLKN